MYVPLFVHSSYSLLRSTIKIKSLVDHCSSLGVKALAITDYHNLFGAMEFSIECAKKKIKPIIGSRVRIEGNREILLYCKNRTGYENLSYLISNSYLTSKGDPEVRWDQLAKKSDGLIAIAVPSILVSSNLSDIKTCAEYLNTSIEWYVGFEHDKCYEQTAHMSSIFNTPVVAVSETYFLHKDDQEAHDILLCIKNKRYAIEENRPRSDARFKLMTPDEMINAFKEYDFAVNNTLNIAKKCSFFLKPTSPRLPKFKTKLNEIDELRRIATEGLDLRIKTYNIHNIEEYRERLNYEIEVIGNIGFPGYFLIVSDFIKFAKGNNIPVGPGRGSGCGSLVAWCIDITEVDPIKFELFFERFLNPGRVSMPDFDIDFSPRGREVVINYVKQKYGGQCVSGIITFGSLSSRAVLKDVGRVLQVSYMKIDHLSKQVQVLFGKVFTLDEMYSKDKAFAEEVESDEALKKTFEISKKLEGLYRHASAHAAGIIITDTPLYRISPLYKDSDSDLPVVQFSMKYAEIAGLVKFDFLGLTALDVIQDVVEEIKKRGIILDTSSIDLDDKETFALMRSGYTKGVFQFETVGMTKLIRDSEADCIEDLIAIVSLYRPGPMDNIPLFIRCKKGEDKIEYKYEPIEKILANTYGIIVYQEQILRIAQDIAGFTLAEADLLRRAMGKKIPEEMAMYKRKFADNTHRLNGGELADAEELFNQIEKFAHYGFNKAHATAYAIIGYIQAYLKKHYTIEFICVSMTAEQHNTEKLVELIDEAKHLNIVVQKPCINSSGNLFEIVNNEIRYSLSAIKNIGEHMASIIINERNKKGNFISLSDLNDRVNLNKREMESLIKSGALDIFGQNRGKLSQMALILTKTDDDFLFSETLLVSDSYNWSKADSAKYQREILGLYLDDHPLSDFKVKNFGWKWISESNLSLDSENVETVCIIEDYVKKFDKRNRAYAICHISDPKGIWQAIVSDDNIESISYFKGKQVWCSARIRAGRIAITNISKIEDRIQSIQNIHIKVKEESDLLNLKDIVEKFRTKDGKVDLYLHTEDVMSIGKIDNASEFINNLSGYNWYAR
jgi:DNA polymerase III subunit alpha